jgi:hypothetical protein
MTARYRGADLYGCCFEHSIVVLDYRTGAARALHGPGFAGILRSVSSSGQHEITQRLESQIMNALRLDPAGIRGLHLRPGRPSGLSFGAEEHEAGLTTPASSISTSPPGVTSAVLSLSIVLAVKHLGRRERRMRRLTTLMDWSLRLPTAPASNDEAEHQVRRIRRLARGLPSRVACLEESVAATVSLALLGKSVTWCHGVAPDPFTFHAWVCTDIADDGTSGVGVPIAEPESTKRYTILRTIPETQLHSEEP